MENLGKVDQDGKGEPLPAGQRLEVVSDEYPRVPLGKTLGGPKTGLVWSREKPTREGWWWYRVVQGDTISVPVAAHSTQIARMAWMHQEMTGVHVEFQGPIQEPAPAEAPKAAEADPPRPVLKSEGYPHSLDDCIRYMDLLAIEGIATGHNERVGGMCLSTAKHLERLKELESEARSARESSSGPTPESSPAAPQGVEARPMKGGADAE